jgi:WD40 repeat protein
MSFRLVVLPSALFIALVGCTKPLPTTGQSSNNQSSSSALTSVSSADNPNADVGQSLYISASLPPTPPPAIPGNDPIVIPCTVQYEDRQTLSAEVEGKIELIASPMTLRNGKYVFQLKDGAMGNTFVEYDPARPHPAIVFHPRDEKKEVPYWKLVDGDRVSEGQILCWLDDQLWASKKVAAIEIKAASEIALKSSKDGVKFSEQKVELDKKGAEKGAVPFGDLLSDLITLSRFVENEAQSRQSIAKAEGDLQEAEVNLRKHQIPTRVDGIIRSIAKRPGEFVHAGEKIMDIQSTEKVRLEGNLDVQYYDRVKRHMEVSIEPALPSGPVKSHAWHRSDVAGIAVTGHAKRPLVVSASLDGSALIWDPNLANELGGLLVPHSLPHPVGVRSVACTPPGAKEILVITGAEDGRVRIWDVSDPAKLPKNPTREPSDFHASGIHAIAVSPDGKFAATAAGREVFIWDLETGKKKYSLPPEHRDSVTSLSFTPQTQLVTASKDGTLKIWKLGSEKAAVAKTVEHRSGTVDTLGVSPDGSRVLFDQDKSRIDLVTLSDAQTTGQISNVGPNIAFSTLAVFKPEHIEPGTPADKLPDYMIATVGGEGDLKGGLQVWRAPRAGGRGAEIARFMTTNRVPVTCAVFSPNKDVPFLVVGTDRGTVHVWNRPSTSSKRLEGRVTNIEPTDPRYVTVRVEMTNKDLGLLDRGAAAVIINPKR